jgi:2-iminoacetate synthase
MRFTETLNQTDRNSILADINAKTAADVEQALAGSHHSLEDFKALISPAAAPYLEQMAALSNRLTQERFGKIIQLYLPLYLSNECTNQCLYCGFNKDNDIERLTLDPAQIDREVTVIKSYGYEHILLVTGENPRHAGLDYFRRCLDQIRPHFALLSMEVQPLETAEYKALITHGLNSVYIYQETYNRENYAEYHPRGKKSNFKFRLETPDRLGEAGIHRIGLGTLLGLDDWRADSFFTALHLKYLEKTYWRTKYSISFPRLRPHVGQFQPKFNITDRELVQLICAYRILDQEVELSISVRESKPFRDNIIKLGITSLSAGSKTEPGGYTNTRALEQFEVHDDRTPEEMVAVIRAQGYEAVWKDWDGCMQSSWQAW